MKIQIIALRDHLIDRVHESLIDMTTIAFRSKTYENCAYWCLMLRSCIYINIKHVKTAYRSSESQGRADSRSTTTFAEDIIR